MNQEMDIGGSPGGSGLVGPPKVVSKVARSPEDNWYQFEGRKREVGPDALFFKGLLRKAFIPALRQSCFVDS